MKPQQGTLHLINSEVRLAREPKPEPEDFFDVHMPGILDDIIQDVDSYKKYLKSWEESTLKVVNVDWDGATAIRVWSETGFIDYDNFLSGQSCLYIPEGDKARVTELDSH